jgi:hypothetical protein
VTQCQQKYSCKCTTRPLEMTRLMLVKRAVIALGMQRPTLVSITRQVRWAATTQSTCYGGCAAVSQT